MPPSLRDASYLWDILEAARSVLEFTAGLSFDHYRAAHPDIPWAKIVAQRNVLAHEYRDIRHERIWQVITEELPGLIPKLAAELPPLPQDPEASG